MDIKLLKRSNFQRGLLFFLKRFVNYQQLNWQML